MGALDGGHSQSTSWLAGYLIEKAPEGCCIKVVASALAEKEGAVEGEMRPAVLCCAVLWSVVLAGPNVWSRDAGCRNGQVGLLEAIPGLSAHSLFAEAALRISDLSELDHPRADCASRLRPRMHAMQNCLLEWFFWGAENAVKVSGKPRNDKDRSRVAFVSQAGTQCCRQSDRQGKTCERKQPRLIRPGCPLTLLGWAEGTGGIRFRPAMECVWISARWMKVSSTSEANVASHGKCCCEGR
ncbi:hypothetical protein B0H63DRAFT_176743 [Podospora didyma]|uniref:Uncharacterized protein n=1 Tax=Podospora didyma TaxID=330526 RepID=A0AAE0TZF6_9PEZI|nr:hypothetical protein B0H63DRAFT_176743 [Podospora didyma]